MQFKAPFLVPSTLPCTPFLFPAKLIIPDKDNLSFRDYEDILSSSLFVSLAHISQQTVA